MLILNTYNAVASFQDGRYEARARAGPNASVKPGTRLTARVRAWRRPTHHGQKLAGMP